MRTTPEPPAAAARPHRHGRASPLLRREAVRPRSSPHRRPAPDSFALRSKYAAGYQGFNASSTNDIPLQTPAPETFAALKVSHRINRRWEGTFHLRAGKRTWAAESPKSPWSSKSSTVSSATCHLPAADFGQTPSSSATFGRRRHDHPILREGAAGESRRINADFGYGHSFTRRRVPKPYERLMRTFCSATAAVSATKKLSSLEGPHSKYWEENRIKPEPTESGSWGRVQHAVASVTTAWSARDLAPA